MFFRERLAYVRPSTGMLAALFCAAVGFAACSAEENLAVRAVFSLPGDATADLYSLPFPNDLRRRSDGTIDLARLSHGQPALIQRYLDIVARGDLGGFGLNSAAFFRFSGPIDPASLPDTLKASMADDSVIQWVDVDEDSPDYGQRFPVRTRFVAAGTRSIGPNYLAVLPEPGFVLRPKTTYAVLITDGLLDAQGISVQPASDFAAVLSAAQPASRLARAHATYAPVRAYLKKKALTGVVAATVFTTGDPAALAGRAREVVYRRSAPRATNLVVYRETKSYYEIHGSYTAPNFQRGKLPYLFPEDGGTISTDIHGDPIVSRSEKLRFALTIPKGKMPKNGWPIVLYAHGTGGSYRSFIYSGVASTLSNVKDAQGRTISKLAVVGIDQVLHGPRAPKDSSPEITFFNLTNPAAAVHNVIQSGIDDFSLLRMVKGLVMSSVTYPERLAERAKKSKLELDPPAKFDPGKLYFMGHSQGGLTAGPFLAHEPEIKGAVLSGAGGNAMLALLGKTQPTDIPNVLSAALRGKIDEFHPVMNLIEQMLEPADTNNYAPMLVRRPPGKARPKHIFLSSGLVDHYTPVPATDALATAIGLPQVGKVVESVSALSLRGLHPTALPVSGNLDAGDTTVTGGLLQYRSPAHSRSCHADSDCTGSDYCSRGVCHGDGHFVVFNVDRARRQYSRFLATLARDGRATILP